MAIRASYETYLHMGIEGGYLLGKMWNDSVEIWYHPENSGQAFYVTNMERKPDELTHLKLVDFWDNGLKEMVEEIEKNEVEHYEMAD